MTKIILRDDQPNNRPTRLSRLAQTTGLLLALSLVSGFAAWLLWLAGCLYDARLVPLCRHNSGAWIVFFGAIALCWLWVAYWLRERLRRRLRRGMYARRTRPVGGLGQTLQRLTHFAIEGEWSEVERGDGSAWLGGARVNVRQHPALYHNRHGWWVEVAIEGGMQVWVGQQDFYEWFLDVVALRHDLNPGESPISSRYWEKRIGKPQWDARCKLLEAVGAAICTTSNPNSRRLVRFDVVGVMEDLEDQVALCRN